MSEAGRGARKILESVAIIAGSLGRDSFYLDDLERAARYFGAGCVDVAREVEDPEGAAFLADALEKIAWDLRAVAKQGGK